MAHQGPTHIPPCPTVEEPNLLLMVVNYSCGYGDSSLAHPWAQGVQSALVATTSCGSVRPTVAPGKSTPPVGTKTPKFTEGRVARKHKCFQQKVTRSVVTEATPFATVFDSYNTFVLESSRFNESTVFIMLPQSSYFNCAFRRRL